MISAFGNRQEIFWHLREEMDLSNKITEKGKNDNDMLLEGVIHFIYFYFFNFIRTEKTVGSDGGL